MQIQSSTQQGFRRWRGQERRQRAPRTTRTSPGRHGCVQRSVEGRQDRPPGARDVAARPGHSARSGPTASSFLSRRRSGRTRPSASRLRERRRTGDRRIDYRHAAGDARSGYEEWKHILEAFNGRDSSAPEGGSRLLDGQWASKVGNLSAADESRHLVRSARRLPRRGPATNRALRISPGSDRRE